MPQAKGPTGAIKETPQTQGSDVAAQSDKYEDEQEEIHGGGATDRYDNSQPGQIDGGDTDKFGIKPPDAMGAGE